MKIRGLKAALNSSNRYTYKAPEAQIDHLIIGGGVVGLATARRLSLSYPEKSTFVVERNKKVGEETSSRNSEVIHAGLYYPPTSLKAQLCILGRELLYQYCHRHNVPFQKCGKLIVATRKNQLGYIKTLHEKASNIHWPSSFTKFIEKEKAVIPTTLLTGDEARSLEPDLSKDIVSALYSPETGIIDSHALMSSLEQEIISSEGGDIVYSTRVVRVDPYDVHRNNKGENGWVVQMVTAGSNTSDTFLARNVINASGLSANLVLNALLPHENRIPMYFARGSYAAYNGLGISHNARLVYPCPDVDADKTGHAFQSLGTHLTRDIEGNIKFGPDIQWISPSGSTSESESYPLPSSSSSPNANNHEEEFSYAEEDIDFWKHHLLPDTSHLESMIKAVKTYLPNVDESKFRPDYAGIRPKLVPPWGGFQDFVFRVDYPEMSLNSSTNYQGGMKTRCPMISMLGIESPGLTASLAIAEKIHAMVSSN